MPHVAPHHQCIILGRLARHSLAADDAPWLGPPVEFTRHDSVKVALRLLCRPAFLEGIVSCLRGDTEPDTEVPTARVRVPEICAPGARAQLGQIGLDAAGKAGLGRVPVVHGDGSPLRIETAVLSHALALELDDRADGRAHAVESPAPAPAPASAS